jgi:hypothetical protein
VESGFRVLVVCCVVFVVLYAILTSVFMNRFVIVLTFGLWYVRFANFLRFTLVFGSCCFGCVCAFSFVVKCRGIDCYRL